MTEFTLRRRAFTEKLERASIDVNKLNANPTLAAAGVGSADLDMDGKIAGAAETDALYKHLDRFVAGGGTKPLTDDKKRELEKLVQAVTQTADDTGPPKEGKGLRIAGYTALGLGFASIILAPLIGLAAPVLLVAGGSYMALKGGARPDG